tara:strand:- start:244 stop:495 length:252 start_codon:yes stop_codon:yes gene_type:complete
MGVGLLSAPNENFTEHFCDLDWPFDKGTDADDEAALLPFFVEVLDFCLAADAAVGALGVVFDAILDTTLVALVFFCACGAWDA